PVPLLSLPANDPPVQGEATDGVTIEEIPADPSTTPIKPRPKIYKLVRSNIGTLMVREESFHTQRSLRRRQRENGEHASSTQDSERLVELDEWTDRPRPMDSGEMERFRYEREINRIDGLLSRVMLSHDLQTEEEHREAPSIRISEPPEVVESMNGFATHQNGTSHRKRRSRRSNDACDALRLIAQALQGLPVYEQAAPRCHIVRFLLTVIQGYKNTGLRRVFTVAKVLWRREPLAVTPSAKKKKHGGGDCLSSCFVLIPLFVGLGTAGPETPTFERDACAPSS
uniref:Uncharacterized protein n=1 Tax=Anopheles maculatus TaxID=74869 RepID=A0A182T3W1_9DIPT